MRTRIKICCIASKREAKLAITAGADAIGLVGKMPSGPGPIEDGLIEEIARYVPPPIASFLLTSEQSSAGIINHVKKVHTNTVQLVDATANIYPKRPDNTYRFGYIITGQTACKKYGNADFSYNFSADVPVVNIPRTSQRFNGCERVTAVQQ